MNQGEAKRSEIANTAREHYKTVSRAASWWCSTIPDAIDAWERKPDLQDRIERLERELRRYKEEPKDELTRLRLKDHDIVVWRTNDPGSASASLSGMWKDGASNLWRDAALPEGVVVLLIRPDEGFDVLTDEALARAGLRRVKPPH